MIRSFIRRLLGKGAADSSAPTPSPAATPDAAPSPAPTSGAPAKPKRARGGAAAGSPAHAGTATDTWPEGQRRVWQRAEHGIVAERLDANAVRVVRTLQEAGHEAYVVGGAVRDLVCGLRPKDFDVATSATPEQVKSLFRRAFIIGRRFRLVHVVFGRGREHEVIEVSTFRAYMDNTAAEQVEGNEKTSKGALADKKHVVDASGRVLRDNVWGPQNEDAARRDFSINAMYYDPITEQVVDYHNGLLDARRRVIRMIGDPAARYREDPVRIIRIVRFAAKLGFDLEAGTRGPIAASLPLLANVPPSRLFDEMVKLLQTGHAWASVEQVRAYGLDRHGVFPALEAALAAIDADPQREALIRRALDDTDQRVAQGKAVVPSYMLACLLWHDVQARAIALQADGEGPGQALQMAVDAVFEARVGDISGRGKLAADMRDIWLMQPRLERRSPGGVMSLLEQPRFRAGFDFLWLRCQTGELPQVLGQWWHDIQIAHDDERERMVQTLRQGSATRVRKVPAPATSTGAQDPNADAQNREGAADPAVDAQAPDGQRAPASRRRRRRRTGPRSGAGSEGAPGAQ